MSVIDEKKLLSNEEREAYLKLLKRYDYDPHNFLLEVTEDQRTMDMNDLDYVIILKFTIIYIQSNIEKIYYSKVGSQTWLAELEYDLSHEYY